MAAHNTRKAGEHGVYLAAAQLAGLGFIVTVTARNAPGADLLVSDQNCKRAYTVQVKTQKKNPNFWLVGKKAQQVSSPTHFYVLINLGDGKTPNFYVVPSEDVKRRTVTDKKGNWHNFPRDEQYKDKWDAFGDPE